MVKQQRRTTYGMNWVKTQMMKDIEEIMGKHKKLPYTNFRFILIRKYGISDKFIEEVLGLYVEMGMVKYDKDFVEWIENDLLREEHKPESKGDRAQPGDEHTIDEKRQV